MTRVNRREKLISELRLFLIKYHRLVFDIEKDAKDDVTILIDLVEIVSGMTTSVKKYIDSR